MEIAKNFTINDKNYESIGKLTINGHTYVVTKNGDDMVLVEANLVNGNYVYSMPQKDENDIQSYKGIMFAEEIIKGIKEDIDNGNITTKEDLQKRLEKSEHVLTSDVELMGGLQGKNMDEFKDSLRSLYEYFDEKVKTAPDIDLSNYVSKEVDGKDYYFDTTNTDKMLVSRDDKTLTEELKNKENDARLNGESITGEEAFSKVENDKETFSNTNIKEINPTDYSSDAVSPENLVGLQVVKSAKKDDENVKGNLETGIYMDEEGKVITTKEVNDDVVAKEGGVISAETRAESTETEIYSSSQMENPLGIDEEQVTLDEVEALLTHVEQLTDEQVAYLEDLRARKQYEIENQLSNGMTNDKQKKLIPPGRSSFNQNSDDRAAYVNLIVLCLFVQVFMLLIIIGTIFFMK